MIDAEEFDLEKIVPAIEDSLRGTIRDVAESAKTWAKILTPELSGKLKSSWKTRHYKTKSWLINDTDYASFVEYGHMTSNNSWFVPGVFMGTRGIEQAAKHAQSIFDQRLKESGL